MKTKITFLIILGLLAATAVTARTKLVTLPGRDLVLLNLEHPNRNLVLEERTITLEKGLTTIAFSWQGVSIDPSSIQLQPMQNPDKVQLISVSYPPNENALEWQVACPEAGKERFRIYYLIGGVGRQMSYRMDVSADERTATLKTHYNLENNSGENFDDTVVYTAFGPGVEKDIDSGAILKMLVSRFDAIPVVKVYKYKPNEHPTRVGFYYEIINSEERGLGKFRLPVGKVRIYQQSSAGDDVFLGEDVLEPLAVLEKAYLYLGEARDITMKRNVMDTRRDNIRRNTSKQMVLWDEVQHVRYELQNFKDESADLIIEEVMNDVWDVEELGGANARYERKNNGLLEITVTIPPKGEKVFCDLTTRKTNQTNQKY